MYQCPTVLCQRLWYNQLNFWRKNTTWRSTLTNRASSKVLQVAASDKEEETTKGAEEEEKEKEEDD